MADLVVAGWNGISWILCSNKVCLLYLFYSVISSVLSRSLQLIPPTTVAVVRAMEIVLAYGVQAAVLGEVSTLCLVHILILCLSVS